jgi:hypothetical protein
MSKEKTQTAAIASLIALGILLTVLVQSVEVAMEDLVLQLDGKSVVTDPGPRRDGDHILVPLLSFAKAVGAEAKVLEVNGPLAVCRDDLCIPLNDGSTIEIDDIVFARLAAFGEPLGLSWEVGGDTLRVKRSGSLKKSGVGIGDRPPEFSLPDLYTGTPVSLQEYRGRKTVFYMWASW